MEEQVIWYEKIQALTKLRLTWELGNWKQAYQIVESILKGGPRSQLNAGNSLAIKVLLKLRQDLSSRSSELLQIACEVGDLELVKMLLSDKKTDAGAYDNRALSIAVQEGQLDVVELLLESPQVDPSDADNHALDYAVSTGQSDMVRLLLTDSRVDPSRATLSHSGVEHVGVVVALLEDYRANPTRLAGLAVINGHEKVVRMIVADPRFDQSIGNYDLLFDALTAGHKKVATLLFENLKIRDSVDDSFLGYLVADKFSRGRYSKKLDVDYSWLLWSIIFRRPILEEMLGWLIAEGSERTADHDIVQAAKYVLGRINPDLSKMSGLFVAYSGLLLLIYTDNVRNILHTLRTEGASEEGLSLAARLVGAFLGYKFLSQDELLPLAEVRELRQKVSNDGLLDIFD